MVSRFCFKCGKKTNKLIDGYCSTCYKQRKVKKKEKEKIYELCKKCGYMKINGKWTLQHKQNVKIKNVVCDVCSKKYGDYYEAILQLRGDFQERHVDFCKRFLNKLERKEDRMAFFFLSGKNKEIDLKIGSKKAAKKLAKSLKNRYGCKIKKSYKLYSRKAGKNIVRDTILCRF
ncbi:MAG: hypothetical protein J7K26_02910 [Candidatus Aenigmarchaeota archaeon]|nr:hypothetical protein [Candidatus Aenigmarchaeota archaeon]